MAEAMEFVNNDQTTRLALGCMSYYAALHQTVIGLEIKKQLELVGKEPEIMIGCVGGGTNFMGMAAPFLADKVRGDCNATLIAVEASNVPVLTTGKYQYDFQDFSGFTPRVKMYTLGHEFIPPKIHSGGLRYHGKSPILSLLYHHKLLSATTVDQKEAFDAGMIFYNAEGIIPAPETGHAIAQTIREVKNAKEEGINKDILFLFSGTGYLDLESYMDVLKS
jgi:tryptophan synthase beta chain